MEVPSNIGMVMPLSESLDKDMFQLEKTKKNKISNVRISFAVFLMNQKELNSGNWSKRVWSVVNAYVTWNFGVRSLFARLTLVTRVF